MSVMGVTFMLTSSVPLSGESRKLDIVFAGQYICSIEVRHARVILRAITQFLSDDLEERQKSLNN